MQSGPPTAEITIKSDNRTYHFDGQNRQGLQDFIRALQLNLPARKYPVTNRLYKIAAYAIGDTKVRGISTDDQAAAINLRSTYEDWDEFVDRLATHDLVAARIDSYVKHRPRRLGSRPGWFKDVDVLRPPGQGQAIRHIVPSHLLGYAAEHLPRGQVADDHAMAELANLHRAMYTPFQQRLADDGLIKREDVGLPRTTVAAKLPKQEWQRKRWIWELMYNHPGNLWVGESDDNSTIGLMQGAVQSTIRSIEATVNRSTPMTPTRSMQELRRNLPDWFMKPKRGSQNLREEITWVLNGAVQQYLTANSPIEDILEFLQDVASNLDLDTPELVEWESVVAWRTRFEADPTEFADVAKFMQVSFAGSLLADATGRS